MCSQKLQASAAPAVPGRNKVRQAHVSPFRARATLTVSMKLRRTKQSVDCANNNELKVNSWMSCQPGTTDLRDLTAVAAPAIERPRELNIR